MDDGPTGYELAEIRDRNYEARIRELESKLGEGVSFQHRPESAEWQADYGDHHALGATKARAMLELGIYLVRLEATK